MSLQPNNFPSRSPTTGNPALHREMFFEQPGPARYSGNHLAGPWRVRRKETGKDCALADVAHGSARHSGVYF